MAIINSTLRQCGFISLLTLIFSVAMSQTDKQKGNSRASSTQVTTASGILEGVPLKSGIIVFRGIPYAAPPVGDLRWREPQPAIRWLGVKKADKFGPAAVQVDQTKGGFYQHEFYAEGDPERSEDCLYLNVWIPPLENANQKLPVAMYIHGGGFEHGFGHEIEFDGEAWAKRGVILITINYRLGLLGFLSHPLLSAESDSHTSGNQAILDQIAALKWITTNIEQFGGDPNNVTVFGQSAGAVAVQTLCASPLTKGLIAKAIIMSGGGVNPNPATNELASSQDVAKNVLDYFGMTSLDKMRSFPAIDLFSLSSKYTKEMREKQGLKSGSSWIGEVSASKTLATKGYQSYDELMGSMALNNKTTASSNRPQANLPISSSNIRTLRSGPIVDGHVITESFSDAARAGHLPKIPYMIGFVSNDVAPLAQGIDTFCLLMEKHGNTAYAYEFAHEVPGDDAGAFHSGELWYVFGTVARSWRPMSKADIDLSNRMVDCWTNFAKFGNPNSPGTEVWKPFANANQQFYKFDTRK